MATPPTAGAASPTGPLDPRQRAVMFAEMHQSALDGRQAQIHTAMPGHIVSYNPATMTVTVQPDIQGVLRNPDGTKLMVAITPIADVPVCFPGGGGHILTFPIGPGDDCLIMFAERSIDNWFQHGGTQSPSDFRMHDINDAFVLVGVRSQPKRLGASGTTRAAAPPASAGTVQLRSDDGQTYIEIDGAGHAVNVRCPGTIQLDCVTLHVTGTIMCDSEVFAQANTMGFVTLSKHHNHQGGGQNNPPTPGT